MQCNISDICRTDTQKPRGLGNVKWAGASSASSVTIAWAVLPLEQVFEEVPKTLELFGDLLPNRFQRVSDFFHRVDDEAIDFFADGHDEMPNLTSCVSLQLDDVIAEMLQDLDQISPQSFGIANGGRR